MLAIAAVLAIVPAVAGDPADARLEELALRDPDSGVRHDAVSRLSEPDVLARIAERTVDRGVRTTAVARISDPAILRRLATTAAYWHVRFLASSRVDDVETLRRIALEDPERNVRGAAVGRIRDDAVLEAVLAREPDPDVRLEAVQGIAGADALERVASDPGGRAPERRLAVRKLPTDDQRVRLARRSELSTDVRLAAVAAIVDSSLLELLAAEPGGDAVAAEAAGRLRERGALACLLREAAPVVRAAAARALARVDPVEVIASPDPELRLEAVPLLAPGFLGAVALADPAESVRAAAARRVESSTALPVSADRSAAVRAAAATRLDAEPRLRDLAAGDPEPVVREAAVRRLPVGPLRDRLAREDPDAAVRRAALADVRDGSLLAEAARRDPVPSVRIAALQNVQGDDLLVELALRDESLAVRTAAAAAIVDGRLLEQVASGARDPYVRFVAAERQGGAGAALADSMDPEKRQAALEGAVKELAKICAAPLAPRLRTSWRDTQYAEELPGETTEERRGTVSVERVEVAILDGQQRPITELIAQGERPSRAETFSQAARSPDGLLHERRRAVVDLVLLLRTALDSMPREVREAALAARDEHLRTAALLLRDGPPLPAPRTGR